MAVRVGGRLHGLWRAVDEHGQPLDMLLQSTVRPRPPSGSSAASSSSVTAFVPRGSRPTSSGATRRYRATLWWVRYSFDNVKRVGAHTGSGSLAIGGVVIGHKLRAGRFDSETVIMATEKAAVAHNLPPIEF